MSKPEDAKFRTVFAERFIVPDTAGRPRVVIDNKGVTLASKTGFVRASLFFNPENDDPEFVICDNDDNVRANFFIHEGDKPRLILRDRLGNPRVVLTLADDDFPEISLFGEGGVPVFQAP